MSRLFAQKLQSPAHSMARGPLLQLLLIQTQVYILLQAVTAAHGVDAHGVGANSAQPHGLGEPFTTVLPVRNRP